MRALRALVVDDERVCRRMGSYLLEKLGAEVEEATDGEVALSAVHGAISMGKPFDFILVDLVMDRMSGEVLAEKLAQLDPRPTIAICTGTFDFDDLGLTPEYFKARYHVDAVMMKPLQLDELKALIQRHQAINSAPQRRATHWKELEALRSQLIQTATRTAELPKIATGLDSPSTLA